VNIGHTASHGILNRDHAQISRTILDMSESIFKRRTWNGLRVWVGLFAGDVGIGASLTLENDFHWIFFGFSVLAQRALLFLRKALCAFRTTASLRCFY
jgi:hypothetical protein